MPDLPVHNLNAPLPKIVVIVGPTAVGKTALAIDIAETFGAETLNIDRPSTQELSSR